jgi:hypothetical protein
MTAMIATKGTETKRTKVRTETAMIATTAATYLDLLS